MSLRPISTATFRGCGSQRCGMLPPDSGECMDSQALDRMIDRLGSVMPSAPPIFVKATRQDWRPFWALAGEVQQAFKSGVRYPTRELREAAWLRFNVLRDEANRRATAERAALHSHSKNLRDIIFSDCRGIIYSPLTDVLFFFDRTTVSQVKGWQGYLADAMQRLSKWKYEMLGEHKQECFERLQEVKRSHDLFWEQYRSAHQARHAEKQTQWRSKRREIIAGVERNLEKNREQLGKTSDALRHNRNRADELRDKIRETTSAKWEGIFETWLSETEAKIDDIENHMTRIQGWIEEGERRLCELREGID